MDYTPDQIKALETHVTVLRTTLRTKDDDIGRMDLLIIMMSERQTWDEMKPIFAELLAIAKARRK